MLIIRKESSDDFHGIESVFQGAFHGREDKSNRALSAIKKLRRSPCFTFALVAEYKGEVVAHITTSSIKVEGQNANIFTINTLAVLPDFQSKGVAKKLVKVALSRLKKRGAHCCVLISNSDFYHSVGFSTEFNLTYPEAPQQDLQSFYFKEIPLKGEINFIKALKPLARLRSSKPNQTRK